MIGLLLMAVKAKKKKKSIDKILLDLWAEAVKIRAGHKCEYCGIMKTLNSHHIFSKRHRATRWDIDNGICLCSGCHTLRTFSAHQSPDFVLWIIKYIKVERYKKIQGKAYQVKKWTEVEKEEIKVELENYIEGR